jgi:hypothetical protein
MTLDIASFASPYVKFQRQQNFLKYSNRSMASEMVTVMSIEFAGGVRTSAAGQKIRDTIHSGAVPG